MKTYRKPIGHLEESDRTHRGNLKESYRKPKEDQEETQSNHIENIWETHRKPKGIIWNT